MDLKVIGAGLGRTGTTSLKEALTILLAGPCFHFLEYKTRTDLMPPWLEFVQSYSRWEAADAAMPIPKSQWEKLMPGYVACVDEPASYYWKQLWQTFPDALVILSTRDSLSWWESVQSITKQVMQERNHPEQLTESRRHYLDFLFALYPELDESYSQAEEIGFFETHNNKVINFAEENEAFKQRLLVWRAEEGWQPICQALDLPVPDMPFPHSNRRTEYHGY